MELYNKLIWEQTGTNSAKLNETPFFFQTWINSVVPVRRARTGVSQLPWTSRQWAPGQRRVGRCARGRVADRAGNADRWTDRWTRSDRAAASRFRHAVRTRHDRGAGMVNGFALSRVFAERATFSSCCATVMFHSCATAAT